MIQNQNLPAVNAQRMTSLEIAEVTGKPHNDVLKAIRKMEPAWAKVTQGNFSLSAYQDTTGRTLPCYALTKVECLYIATKFNDEARAKLVVRWYELEQERLKREGVRMLMVTDEDVVHEADAITGRTLVSFNQHADGCITAKDIAQTMGLEVKELNAWLTDMGVQVWRQGRYRLTPNYEGLGLAQDRLFIYYSKGGKKKERTYLVWTPKGAEMIGKMTCPRAGRPTNRQTKLLSTKHFQS